MSYRPQFPFKRSPCLEQRCMYSFDATNLPVFTGTLLNGQITSRIPLHLDKDSEFVLRAVVTQGPISIRLETPGGDPLGDSDNAQVSTNYNLPTEYCSSVAGVVPLEGGEGVESPDGANYLLYMYNGTGRTINLNTCVVNLHGLKRYPSEVCR